MPKNENGGRPQGPKRQPRKPKPLYQSKPPKGRDASPRRPQDEVGSSRRDDWTAGPAVPTNNIGHPISSSHFELREDGSIAPSPHPDPLPKGEGTATGHFPKIRSSSQRQPADDNSPSPGGEGRDEGGQFLPHLIFRSENPFIRLYHGNALELLDAIFSKYPEGRFDCIFADPPYFLSNGGITCHAGESHFMRPQLALTA